MGEQHRSGNGKKIHVGNMALVVCLVLFVILAGAVIGRYQRQFRSDGSVRAQEFYFTSDFLDGETHTLAPGSEEISFTLRNHADELRYSEVDITYEVTVTRDGGGQAASVEYTNTEHKLNKNSKEDHTVTIQDLRPGTYTVTATGTGGYKKTLTATIVVLSSDAQLYQHQEVTPEYTLLTVWNEGDTEGTVTIEYVGIPDNTNPNMTDWITGTETDKKTQTVKIDPHASKVFRFFNSGTITVKKDGTDVTTSQLPN